MVISLTGMPGSGKSTVGRELAKSLGVPFYSMGDLRAKMAMERGLTIDQLNELGEREAFTDNDADAYQTKLGESGESFVVDGRLSWHFIPRSFKVFLDVDDTEGARRIYGASQKHARPDERPYASVDDAKEAIAARVASDRRRYEKYYGVDFTDRARYDLVVDTTSFPAKEVIKRILDNLPARS